MLARGVHRVQGSHGGGLSGVLDLGGGVGALGEDDAADHQAGQGQHAGGAGLDLRLGPHVGAGGVRREREEALEEGVGEVAHGEPRASVVDVQVDVAAVGAALGEALAARPAVLADSAFAIELGRWLVGEAGGRTLN